MALGELTRLTEAEVAGGTGSAFSLRRVVSEPVTSVPESPTQYEPIDPAKATQVPTREKYRTGGMDWRRALELRIKNGDARPPRTRRT